MLIADDRNRGNHSLDPWLERREETVLEDAECCGKLQGAGRKRRSAATWRSGRLP
ncbi:hypothetical protein MM59RIKEN_02560 [Pusillibacter faecalis]|uniref:Uncharacterized protein n=1 Tax=Pusillibacter faecalis TaxID=2714358 RepID=A0A810Q9L1_9FIRM|nr:hypothetical protein MM59RIKEN_02560 [Pusillibacter faecalis]